MNGQKFNFKVNAEILDEARLNKYHNNRESYEAKGLRITRIGREFLVVDRQNQSIRRLLARLEQKSRRTQTSRLSDRTCLRALHTL